ncbi:hypothetical protein CEXT_743601 [Caerostris extrusa]|uniref:Uncharacterized protein n=1 Tax=Caerostris extrusa TaxID=172846 RepID=A0AAV4MAX1_CAEEX|nr:hypothetical protein CEXT_743601 [Caerostris extrusa]
MTQNLQIDFETLIRKYPSFEPQSNIYPREKAIKPGAINIPFLKGGKTPTPTILFEWVATKEGLLCRLIVSPPPKVMDHDPFVCTIRPPRI